MNEIISNILAKIQTNEVKEYKMLSLLDEYYEYIDEVNEDRNRVIPPIYPDEYTKSLEERDSGIYEALEILTGEVENLNEGNGGTPLMPAVGHADAAMTSYLIKHGADPSYWPDMEQDKSNYYYDSLDIGYLMGCWGVKETYVDALINTAKVLVKEGNLGAYSGFCLVVDTAKRKISFSPPQYLY